MNLRNMKEPVRLCFNSRRGRGRVESAERKGSN